MPGKHFDLLIRPFMLVTRVAERRVDLMARDAAFVYHPEQHGPAVFAAAHSNVVNGIGGNVWFEEVFHG